MGLSFVYLYFSALFFVLVHSKHHGLRRRDDSPSPIIGLGSLVAACDRGDPETTYYTAEVGVLFTVVTQNCPGAGLDTVAGSQNINGDYYPISATKRQSDSCSLACENLGSQPNDGDCQTMVDYFNTDTGSFTVPTGSRVQYSYGTCALAFINTMSEAAQVEYSTFASVAAQVAGQCTTGVSGINGGGCQQLPDLSFTIAAYSPST